MVDKSTGNAPPVEEFNKSPGEGRVRVASDQSSSEERDENTPPPTSQVTITHRGSDFILEGMILNLLPLFATILIYSLIVSGPYASVTITFLY